MILPRMEVSVTQVLPGEQFYKHSGRITPLGLLLGILAGAVTAIVAAIVYAYADLYIPLIYLNALLCIFFGVVVGAASAVAMQRGKVRNIPVALFIVTLVTALAYYVCWVVWMSAVIDRYGHDREFSWIWLASHPHAVWQLGTFINEKGTWALGHSDKENTNGIFLGIIWIFEGVTIFVSALLVAKSVLGDRPFCERCNQWCTKETQLTTVAATNVAAIKQMVLEHRFNDLAALGDSDNHWIALMHQYCDNCKMIHTITAGQHRITVDKRGRRQTTKTMLINKMLVSAEEVERIRAMRKAPSPAIAPPPPSAPMPMPTAAAAPAPAPPTVAATAPASPSATQSPPDSELGIS